ncbi:hypothetical protein FBUS_03563 [Fasciolopsis buskii]|uniref:Uncharacterized protein n=1 Tax=Fasciolopsis buskii TaxID=27845 RepID=A0A8E0S7Y9_9TREM|nr:hypothetical protein FBUS_03563 [Fasciolopsis buski]
MARWPFLHSNICTFLFVLLYIVSLVQAFPDEYLPKRIDPKSSVGENSRMMQDLSMEPDSSPSVNMTQTKPYLPVVTPCDTSCFLEPPAQEILQCAKPFHSDSPEASELPRKLITCQLFRTRGEIVLGQKESARAIRSGALENLIDPHDDWSNLAGQLAIHLNLNMVQLDAGAFVGLETMVTEVRLLNTVFMHPDSFLTLRHLRAFEIDSGLSPVPLTDDSLSEAENWQTSNKPDQPMFLRLRPVDSSVPISFNLETECYQCVIENSSYPFSDMIIVLFTDSRDSQRKKIRQSAVYHQPQFSMLFPQTCPKVSHGLGCPNDKNRTDEQTISITVDHNRSNELNLNDLRDARIIVAEAKTPSLFILLSIWCSVLTLVIVIIICVVYFCTKRLTSHKPVPKWFPSVCWSQPPSSPDNLSSSSSNSAFYRQSGPIQSEKNSIYPTGMMDSQTSWNSVRAKPPRSTSAQSLRDKHHRPIRASRASIDRIRHGAPARRSIGSQTDFTEIDSDAVVYSSLRRAGLTSRDYFIPDPPVRTSSQFALSRLRYNQRLDGTLPSTLDRRVGYPMQVRYPKQNIFVLPVELDPSDLEQDLFIPIDPELSVPPQPQGLPPIHPTKKSGSHSPAPWRRELQNVLSLDV